MKILKELKEYQKFLLWKLIISCKAQRICVFLGAEVAVTHDSRTRDWHRDLDGVTKPIDEPFENEFGKIMYPGDPAAHGANVYHCRCTITAVVKGFRSVKASTNNVQSAQKSFYDAGKRGIIKLGAKGALTSENDPDFSKRDAHAKQTMQASEIQTSVVS